MPSPGGKGKPGQWSGPHRSPALQKQGTKRTRAISSFTSSHELFRKALIHDAMVWEDLRMTVLAPKALGRFKCQAAGDQ